METFVTSEYNDEKHSIMQRIKKKIGAIGVKQIKYSMQSVKFLSKQNKMWNIDFHQLYIDQRQAYDNTKKERVFT